jgi:hypothetical protein
VSFNYHGHRGKRIAGEQAAFNQVPNGIAGSRRALLEIALGSSSCFTLCGGESIVIP